MPRNSRTFWINCQKKPTSENILLLTVDTVKLNNDGDTTGSSDNIVVVDEFGDSEFSDDLEERPNIPAKRFFSFEFPFAESLLETEVIVDSVFRFDWFVVIERVVTIWNDTSSITVWFDTIDNGYSIDSNLNERR